MEANQILYMVMAIVSVFTSGFAAAAFIVVKFNDLAHAQKDLTEIKANVKEIIDNQYKLDTRLVTMETKCRERHSRKRKTM